MKHNSHTIPSAPTRLSAPQLPQKGVTIMKRFRPSGSSRFSTIAAGLLFTLILFCSATPAAAQSGCVDASGRAVAVVFASINDNGYATQVMGQPVIYLNPMLWQSLTPALQMFVFSHECGHHVLATTDETRADCYGARAVVSAGLDIREVLYWMANNPRSDWTHAPGPARAAAMTSCLAGM